MSESKIILQAENVCACDHKVLFSQMEEKDKKSAERLHSQLERLQELCETYRTGMSGEAGNRTTEKQIRSTMNKIGDMAADFVFEQENSNTAAMTDLLARLGYADGNEKAAGEQLKIIREFGHGGAVEKALAAAGEMSDDAIPVMEAFHHLQKEFMLRESGDMVSYSKNGFFDKMDLKSVKKNSGFYLDTPGVEHTMEYEAVKTIFEASEKAERLMTNMQAERGRMRVSFDEITREENRSRESHMSGAERTRRREIERYSQEKRQERLMQTPEKNMGNRNFGR